MTKFNFAAEPIRECVLQILPSDVRLTTPEMNFGSRGLAREINAIYEYVSHNNVVWQPDVYAEAKAVAAQYGITCIVDVGCGNGDKLIHFFPADKFQTIGLDFHGSLKQATRTYPNSSWVECDLSSSWDMTRAFDELDPNEPVLLILSDVIEHLPDPRLLLAQLRTVLLRHVANRLVLSTPDRALLGHRSPPENLAHVREWTLDELASFCQSAGFKIERAGHTRANQFDEKFVTIYLQLKCEQTEYLGFLKGVGLLHSDVVPSHLLVTSEHAGLQSTGGIGTFVVEQRLAYGMENTLCLFVDQQKGLDIESFRHHQVIEPGMLLDKIDLTLPVEDVVLKAAQQIFFYFPNISKIEYQDYQGLGCRLAQAKCAGMFPPKVQCIAHCHGITHYLENANETWFGKSHDITAVREKISIENADSIVCPTEFLIGLYREIGIEIPEEKLVRLRYPYHFEPVKITKTEQVDTVVFFGKRSAMKGFSLFLGALAADDGYLRTLGIKCIVFIGPHVDETQEDQSRLNLLRSQFEVVEFTSLNRSGAMDLLQSYSNNAICVMPYIADNHPYALLDVTFAGILPLMLRAGGVPELFPPPFDRVLLAEPTEASLLTCIEALVQLAVAERHRLREGFLNAMMTTQTAINGAIREFKIVKQQPLPERPVAKATIIVPVFNTELRFISELVFGLNNQSLPPVEVIFIDDGSQHGYASLLGDLLQRELRLPYRIIRHDVNKGLAAARNTGLNAVRTEYVINVDSDDVPLTNFVKNIVNRLNVEPYCVAAVSYLKAFDEADDFNKQSFGSNVYRPLGDGVVASQLENNLGHANTGYRTSVLRALGGWDESDRSMCEDWALFLKLTSLGHRIGIVPQADLLYRVRNQSMLRTYKVWPAMRRLARNTVGLPLFDSFRLQAVMRHWQNEEKALRTEVSRLSAEGDLMSSELNRRSVRATRSIVGRLARFPHAFGLVRSIGLGVWKSVRWIRDFTVFK